MKKVLIIGITSGIGGTETFITQELERIDSSMFEVDVLLFQKYNQKYAKVLEEKVNNIFYVEPITGNKLKYIVDICNFYIKNKYDIVHVNSGSAKLFVYFWPLFFVKKTKVIVHSHNSNDGSKKIHNILAKFQNILADKMVACSTEAAEWMFGKKRVANNEVQIIKNGVDLNKYKFRSTIREQYRKEYHLSDRIIIGSVARFEKQKNHRRIIDIFTEYHANKKNSTLILIGEGSLRKEIEKYVDEKGISESVIFLGNRNDVVNWLNVFDVLLLPSLYEGLPFIAIEAQATSLPVLTSNDISDEVRITKLVESMSLDENDTNWVLKIDNLILSASQRTELVNEIEDDFSKEGYNLEDTIRNVERIYEDITSEI
ncbi:glycosyl transferase [Ligilactobacillus agilis]|uniref:Glycosyl transferase n=1 Tax=Ligilactobacillus agilis TaxID=1601 RepID=A0A231Q5D1_9LACO|nr:glycosyltransferase family 1 protein [Ligilactobacillus agilis]OXC08652.1 glycosyl transferase [Ligilactobacillus agilis]OXC09932.1 glycosyl transferase [Ligilactobacillus agilis]OXC11760.1 glycosyl transferase [Ligilactobacillus agilis]OXS40269.1 glycosyl transferase [Ligilactobacillus agilis]OXS42177.1 glycosyl transferase [Ligilactobacillus agilis]